MIRRLTLIFYILIINLIEYEVYLKMKEAITNQRSYL